MTDPVRLTAEWTIETDRVSLKYRVSNAGSDPVYVVDGRFEARGGETVWSDRLRVEFRPPATAVLASRLVPLNPSVHYHYPPHTFAVKVPAGESLENTLTAPLALVCDGTTTEPAPEAVVIGGKIIPPPFPGGVPKFANRQIVCRAAVFELGIIPHEEELRAQPAYVADRELFRLEKAAWSLQQIATVEKRLVELPMLVPAAWLPRER
jgi:hypothetical protein